MGFVKFKQSDPCSGEPFVSIAGSTGILRINGTACELFNLKGVAGFDMYYDQEKQVVALVPKESGQDFDVLARKAGVGINLGIAKFIKAFLSGYNFYETVRYTVKECEGFQDYISPGRAALKFRLKL